MNVPLAITLAPVRVTAAEKQPLRVAQPVEQLSSLTLSLRVLEGTDLVVRLLTNMRNESEDGWIELGRWVASSANGVATTTFYDPLRFVRWEVTSTGNATFAINGVGHARREWLPKDLDGCKLWLRADLGVTLSGNNVSAWDDQSGNGNQATQSTATDQPGWTVDGWAAGIPALDFDRANTEYMSLASYVSSASNYTVCAVLDQRNAATILQTVLSSSSNANNINAVTDTAFVGILDNSTWRSIAASTNGKQLLTWVLDDPNNLVTLFRNGASIGTATYNTSTAFLDTPALGKYFSGLQHHLDAKLAELMVFTRVLDSGERALIDAYARARYGL